MSTSMNPATRPDPDAGRARPGQPGRGRRIFVALLMAVWVAVNVICILGLLLPVYPGAMLLTAGLVAGLVYPFMSVQVVIGIVIAAFAWKKKRALIGAVAAVLAVLLAAGIAWPTIGAAQAAEETGTELSVWQLFQSRPAVGRVSPAMTETYRTVDGEDLKVDVWEPVSAEVAEQAHHASLVYVFGGGWVGGDRRQWAPFFQNLTAQGITVFSIDYRLSSPGDPSWSKSITDVRCAIGWVHEQAHRYDLDTDRVAISGGSAGANLALLAAYTDHQAAPEGCGGDTSVRAVLDFYGPTDLKGLEQNSGSTEARDMLHTYLGATSAEEPERYAELSPLNHVSSDAPPTLILHGTHDGMVPAQQSEALAAALNDAGVDNRLTLIGGAQHGFDMIWGTFANQVAQAEVTSFLKEFVTN